jgi:hypothetical protein
MKGGRDAGLLRAGRRVLRRRLLLLTVERYRADAPGTALRTPPGVN